MPRRYYHRHGDQARPLRPAAVRLCASFDITGDIISADPPPLPPSETITIPPPNAPASQPHDKDAQAPTDDRPAPTPTR